MEVHGCKVPKTGRERKQSSRKQTQTEINTSWPSLQFQLGVMGSHIALVLDGSPWSGEARILLMRLTFQCNQTAAAAHKKVWGPEDQRRCCCAAVKQFPENVLLFNMLMIHMKNLLLPTGIFPSSSIPATPGAEVPLLNESFDYCLAIT